MNRRELESNRTAVNSLPEHSNQNLVGYAVVSPQDLMVGRVEQVFLDKNRHLHLIVSRANAEVEPHLVWLSSQFIQTLEPATRSIYVNLSPAELDRLPPYQNDRANGVSDAIASNSESRVVEEHSIPLLEEKLIVKRHKRKVGEIVVRKEVEIRTIQVPLRREKLIVEQLIGTQAKPLAEINLGQEAVVGNEYGTSARANEEYVVNGEFVSPRAASEALEAIALHHPHGCSKVRVELVVDNPEFQAQYYPLLERFSRAEITPSQPELPRLPQ